MDAAVAERVENFPCGCVYRLAEVDGWTGWHGVFFCSLHWALMCAPWEEPEAD